MNQDGKAVYIAGKSWDVEESAAEVADGVNGEYRDRLDKVTNFYTATVDIFQSDQAAMQMIMDAQDADDAAGLPLNQGAAILIKQRDGVNAAYALQECKFGPWKVTNSSRQEAVMLNLKIRFRYFKRIPSL